MQKKHYQRMRPEEAVSIINEVFGYRGQARAAAALRRTAATINRWCTGVTPIGAMEAHMLRLLRGLHRTGVDWVPLIERLDVAERPKRSPVEDLL